jgi:hypothetical protein
MIKKLLFTTVLTTAFLLQACVTAKITSNKQEGYDKKIKKFFILINGSREAKNFFTYFSQGLKSKLATGQVESTAYVRNELSLDSEGDIDKQIIEYNPEALMVIKQTVVHSTNNMVDGGTFEITIIDGETKKPVWKGAFEVYGQFGITEAAQTGVDKLYAKLLEDKLI